MGRICSTSVRDVGAICAGEEIGIPAGLPALLTDLAEAAVAAVSAEALSALQPLASARLGALGTCWGRLRAVVQRGLETKILIGKAGEAASE